MNMKRYLRIFLLAATGITLAGCGFRPLYAAWPGANTQNAFATIAIVSPEDRGDQLVFSALRNTIEAREARGDLPTQFDLSYFPREQLLPLITNRTDTVLRYSLNLSVEYRLTERASGRVLNQGTVSSYAPYNVSRADFANLTAERDARERAARDAAEQIRTRLALYFERQRINANPPPG